MQVGHKFTSWKSNDDPSPGLYTFGIMANGELHFMWNNSQLYYSSGPWAGSYYTNPPQLGRTTPPDVFHYDNSTGSPRIWYVSKLKWVSRFFSPLYLKTFWPLVYVYLILFNFITLLCLMGSMLINFFIIMA